MAIDYSSILTNDQKRSILSQRIQQFAAEAYQHEMNKVVAEASNNEEGIKSIESSLAILEKAIEVHKEELSKIPADEQ